MKSVQKIKSGLLLGIAAISISTLYYSCQKTPNKPMGWAANEGVSVENAQSILSKISKIKIVNTNTGKVIGAISTLDGGFSFADPHEGFAFSSPNGVQYSEADGSLYVTAAAFGENSGGGGGIIQAGSTSMDINYTICISADDSSSGFSFGPTSEGTSTVFGISGDFDQILSGDTSGGIESLFNGFAMYQVYDDEASGTYDIVNWLEDLNEPEDALQNKGFAWIIDFKKLQMYFSKSGSLNVSGGTIGFQGKYFEFIPEEDAEDMFDLGDDPEVNVVDGTGSMGCN